MKFRIFQIICYSTIFLAVALGFQADLESADSNPIAQLDHFESHADLLLRKGPNGRARTAAAKHDYQIWPQPASVSMSTGYLTISSVDFKMVTSSGECDVITAAVKRYRDRMFTQDCSKLDFNFRGKFFYQNRAVQSRGGGGRPVGTLKSLKLTWNGKCERYPQMASSESYNIRVDSRGWAEIKAASIWGILRGLETFSQLLENIGPNQFSVHVAEIHDSPRFAHRQLMIDTSRHFLSVRSILKMLDAMELNKLNVLHWHVVDDQAFPFESETFPELSRNGSYLPSHVYTVKDVERILEYARLRGIRILAEFDTPGHTLSWGKGMPSLLTQCYTNGKPDGKMGPIDPTRKSNYDFLRKFFAEIARRFPDQYLHLGGDEVDSKCWASNPRIKKLMEQKRMTKLGQVETYYIQRLVNMVTELRKSYIVWQDVFDEGVKLAPDTLVHVWIEKRNGGWRWKMDQVTKAGFRALLSAPWYLEEAYTEAWRRYYETDLLDWNGDAAQKARVLGGGACMWGEYADGGNLINKVWPTTSALAEKLWSPQSLTKASAKAETRFHAQQCRMQVLGVRSGPQDGPGFCPCDYAVY